jgi:AcrR family transcriptional regulator
MCPRTKEQFELIRENKKEQIINAAIECFGTRGYYSVTISQLAKDAGISKGLLYNYYSSKEDLLKQIFHRIMKEFIGYLDSDNDGIIEKHELLEYFDKIIEFLQNNIPLGKMYISIFSQPSVLDILNEEIVAASRQPLGMITRYFEAQGYEDPELEVAFLSTLFSGMMSEYLTDPEHFPLEKIKMRIKSFYK